MTPSFARRFSFHLLAGAAVTLVLNEPALAQSANVERVTVSIEKPMSDERLVEDTLFLACTRPAMILGVTMEAMGLNVIFSSILFILAGSLLYGLVALPIHFTCRLVCRRDANQFRILFAWFETRGRHRNANLWGGSSCTPLRLVRRFRAEELTHV